MLMVITNTEIVFPLALFIITANIILCSWVVNRKAYLIFAAWIVRITAVLPGFLAVAFGLYFSITDTESTLGMTLFSAGLLVEFGAIQLLSMLFQLNAATSGNSNNT